MGRTVPSLVVVSSLLLFVASASAPVAFPPLALLIAGLYHLPIPRVHLIRLRVVLDLVNVLLQRIRNLSMMLILLLPTIRSIYTYNMPFLTLLL